MDIKEQIKQHKRADEALKKALEKLGKERVMQIAKEVNEMNIPGPTMEEYKEFVDKLNKP